jgi:hypothetical protein
VPPRRRPLGAAARRTHRHLLALLQPARLVLQPAPRLLLDRQLGAALLQLGQRAAQPVAQPPRLAVRQALLLRRQPLRLERLLQLALQGGGAQLCRVLQLGWGWGWGGGGGLGP